VWNVTESGALVTWVVQGPPYISAHAYLVIYWPEVDTKSAHVIRHVTADVTQFYVDNLHMAALYNVQVRVNFIFTFTWLY